MCIIKLACAKITEILHNFFPMCLRTRNSSGRKTSPAFNDVFTYLSVLDIAGYYRVSGNYDKIYGYVDIYVNLLIVSKQLYHTICIYGGIFSYIICGRQAKITGLATCIFQNNSLARITILFAGFGEKYNFYLSTQVFFATYVYYKSPVRQYC